MEVGIVNQIGESRRWPVSAIIICVNASATVLLDRRQHRYVSCKRPVDPRPLSKPVIVLSKNDGCAIAKPGGAKAIWDQMRASRP